MNKNWWDLVGLIGRSNDLSSIPRSDILKPNSTEVLLPEWVLQRLDDFFENVVKNESIAFR